MQYRDGDAHARRAGRRRTLRYRHGPLRAHHGRGLFRRRSRPDDRHVRALRAPAAGEPELPGRGRPRAGDRVPARDALRRPEHRLLRGLPVFSRAPAGFWEYLAGLRFTGDVHAIPEGTVVFAGEPLVRVRAPLIEAQIVETFLLATVNHQTLVASKA